MNEPEPKKWMYPIPWGVAVAAGLSTLFGVGVMFLATINNGFKESFYGGFGAGLICFTVLAVIWVITRFARENDW